MAEADRVTQHGSQTSSDARQAATEMGIGKLVCKRHAFLQNTVATKIAASPWTDFWRVAAPLLAAFRHLRNVVSGVLCDSAQSRSCATSSGTAPDRSVVAVAGTSPSWWRDGDNQRQGWRPRAEWPRPRPRIHARSRHRGPRTRPGASPGPRSREPRPVASMESGLVAHRGGEGRRHQVSSSPTSRGRSWSRPRPRRGRCRRRRRRRPRPRPRPQSRAPLLPRPGGRDHDLDRDHKAGPSSPPWPQSRALARHGHGRGHGWGHVHRRSHGSRGFIRRGYGCGPRLSHIAAAAATATTDTGAETCHGRGAEPRRDLNFPCENCCQSSVRISARFCAFSDLAGMTFVRRCFLLRLIPPVRCLCDDVVFNVLLQVETATDPSHVQQRARAPLCGPTCMPFAQRCFRLCLVPPVRWSRDFLFSTSWYESKRPRTRAMPSGAQPLTASRPRRRPVAVAGRRPTSARPEIRARSRQHESRAKSRQRRRVAGPAAWSRSQSRSR